MSFSGMVALTLRIPLRVGSGPHFSLRIPCFARSPARPSMAGRSPLSWLTPVRALAAPVLAARPSPSGEEKIIFPLPARGRGSGRGARRVAKPKGFKHPPPSPPPPSRWGRGEEFFSRLPAEITQIPRLTGEGSLVGSVRCAHGFMGCGWLGRAHGARYELIPSAPRPVYYPLTVGIGICIERLTK